MKKMILAAATVAALALTGCGHSAAPPGTATAPPAVGTNVPGVEYVQVPTPRGTVPCVTLWENGIDCDWSAVQ